MENKLITIVEKFISTLSMRLPDDVYSKLREARKQETIPKVIAIYDSMFGDLELASTLCRPVCQDTGAVQIFIKVGTRFPLLDVLEPCLRESVIRATRNTPLRPNAVEPFAEVNTGNNVGTGLPYFEYELVPESDSLELNVYMAGGGCSLPGKAEVLPPAYGYKGVADFVLKAVTEKGINACPPVIVGVGIGTCMATSAHLAKRASLRGLYSHNPSPVIAEFEDALESAINKTNVGAQGLGGNVTALKVNVEAMAHHPSALGVAVSFGCWAHRRGTLVIDKDLNFRSTTHGDFAL